MTIGDRRASDAERLHAYVNALLQADNEEQLLRHLNQLRVEKPFFVRMKVLYSSMSPAQVFAKLAEAGDLENISKAAPTYIYTCEAGSRPNRFRIPLAVVRIPVEGLPENVQVLVSVCTRNEWQCVSRLVRKQYPRLVPILLSQSEMLQGLRELGMRTGHAVKVKSYSARERIGSPETREWKTKREWTDEDLEEVIATVQERSEVLKSLDVVFYPRSGEATHIVPSAVCKLRKTGEIEVDGSFEIAFESVAAVIAEAGLRKLTFFAKRGLRLAGYKPRPMAIQYAQPVFEDLENVRNLVALLSKYPHSMHAVQHGNPYAHLKLVDMLDHSSFDILGCPT